MPIYEFHCETCDVDFEQLFRSVASRPEVSCPECGGKRTRRMLSLFGMSSSRDRGAAGSSRSSCASCAASTCAGCRK